MTNVFDALIMTQEKSSHYTYRSLSIEGFKDFNNPMNDTRIKNLFFELAKALTGTPLEEYKYKVIINYYTELTPEFRTNKYVVTLFIVYPNGLPENLVQILEQDRNKQIQ